MRRSLRALCVARGTDCHDGPLDFTGAWHRAGIATIRPGSALALVDLRHFGARINEPYGHQVGDRVLRTVARRLVADLAPSRVFRHGGDAFLIELPGSLDADGATLLARRIGALLAQPIDGLAEPLGAWIGITLLRVVDDVTPILRDVEHALELAKSDGLPFVVGRPAGIDY